jgi:hypothetical protein
MYRIFTSEEQEVHRLLVTGFFEANEIPDPHNVTHMSQIVVDTFSDVYGFKFGARQVYRLTKAIGLPNELAKSTRMRYECQQKIRIYQQSLHHFTRTRIRRRKLVRYPCSGHISVYFPDPQVATSFDFAIECAHALHPGATQFGVPKVVRDWIRKNPRPSPLAQREDLLSAIDKGEIPGIDASRHLSASHISYWWRKGVAKTIYVSKDKWENVAHFLRTHTTVSPLFVDPFVMVGQRCYIQRTASQTYNMVCSQHISNRPF